MSVPPSGPVPGANYCADSANNTASVAIAPGASFVSGAPVPLFSIEGLVLPPFHQGFAVSPDGPSFIILEDRGNTDSRGRYAVLTLNWLSDLGKPGARGKTAR